MDDNDDDDDDDDDNDVWNRLASSMRNPVSCRADTMSSARIRSIVGGSQSTAATTLVSRAGLLEPHCCYDGRSFLGPFLAGAD